MSKDEQKTNLLFFSSISVCICLVLSMTHNVSFLFITKFSILDWQTMCHIKVCSAQRVLESICNSCWKRWYYEKFVCYKILAKRAKMRRRRRSRSHSKNSMTMKSVPASRKRCFARDWYKRKMWHCQKLYRPWKVKHPTSANVSAEISSVNLIAINDTL